MIARKIISMQQPVHVLFEEKSRHLITIRNCQHLHVTHDGFLLLTTLKSFVIDVWQDPKDASGSKFLNCATGSHPFSTYAKISLKLTLLTPW